MIVFPVGLFRCQGDRGGGGRRAEPDQLPESAVTEAVEVFEAEE